MKSCAKAMTAYFLCALSNSVENSKKCMVSNCNFKEAYCFKSFYFE